MAGWRVLHTTAGEIQSHPQALVTALRETLEHAPVAGMTVSAPLRASKRSGRGATTCSPRPVLRAVTW
jgi:hypothetical protein